MFHVKHHPPDNSTIRLRFTWNTLTSLGRRKAKQCFTWNKWVVVKTSCFTWNIEKHWNTRKHKTKWQNPANPTFICANTPQPPHKTSFKTRPQAQKISFTSITYVPCETQQLNKLQQPTTFHVKHQLPTTNREETTLLNIQPANRSTPQCFTWNATTRSMNSPLQLRQLMKLIQLLEKCGSATLDITGLWGQEKPS